MAAQVVAYAALAGLQLLSGIQQANNIQRQAEIQKKIDEFNKDQLALDAFNAEADGYTQMARYQNVIDQIQAAEKVAYLDQNVDPNFGTAKDIQDQSSVNGMLNKIDIQNQAHMKALGFKFQLNNMKLQSDLGQLAAETQAIGARNTAILNASGTALKSAESSGMFKGSTGYEKPPTNSQSSKNEVAGFNYDAYYGFSPRSRA